MTKTAIHVDHIARVEGHGNVHVVIEDGEVKTVEMNVVEPARLFESMVRGRRFEEIPYISSRICGICSSSHVVTDLKAIERVFGVEVTARTRALRELLVYGSYLQNHASHLFVFAAPDFLGMPSVFPLAQTDPELFEQALGLKALGNELCTKVGGRSIHPITAVVGGFTHEIEPAEYLELADKMDAAMDFALEAVDLFRGFEVPDIATAGDMLAMVEDDYYPVECSDQAFFLNAGIVFDANEVQEHIEEHAVPHSAALLARVRETQSPYFTGALARVNASWQNLGQNAKVAAAKAGLRPPEANPFMNNVAQAVEIVDALARRAGRHRQLQPARALRGEGGARRGLHRGSARRAVPRPHAGCRGTRDACVHSHAYGAERGEPGSRHAPFGREAGGRRGCGRRRAPRDREARASLRSLPQLQRALNRDKGTC